MIFSFVFAENTENTNAFSKYMSPEGGINPSSGTVALQKDVASLSAGQVSVNFSLKYSGNVFKEAETPNNETSSDIVGLGWSLGRAKIICNCKNNSFLDDDVYFLVTAEGNRYQIFDETAWRKTFKENYNEGDPEKWRVEGNPYWKVERVVGSSLLLGEGHHVWKYVKYWKITDASGIVHIYGDSDEKYSLTGPSSTGKATEYDLIWLKNDKNDDAFGLMEDSYGGKPSYYPVAWNLSKEISLDGSSLVYNYEQEYEKLFGRFYLNNDDSKIENWDSGIPYTKASYLTNVTASNGSSIDFSYQNKGQDLFNNEFIDEKGDFEDVDSEGLDMFKEKMQRKYLSQIITKNNDGKIVGTVNFCYSFLREGTNYVKRLLSSIRFFDKNSKEIDYEEYSYFTNEKSSMKSSEEKDAYPLGALYEVRGKQCGVVRYSYVAESLGEGHSEILPVDSIFGVGVLEDGTSYLVARLNKKMKVFTRVLGRWVESIFKEDDNFDVSRVNIGDAGWFMAVEENKCAHIFQWNGMEWVETAKQNYKTTEIESVTDIFHYEYENVVAGPDYAIVFSIDKDDNNRFKWKIFWNKWGKTYSEGSVKYIDDNNGSGYQIVPLKNHILIQVKQRYCTGNCLDYRVYPIRDGEICNPKEVVNRDSDNNIYLNGSWLVDVGEADHWYDPSRVQINAWNGSGWIRQKTYGFSNKDPADIRAFGSNYIAVRYNGKRHLRVFDFDGNLWNPEALHEKVFNYHLSSDFYWDGKGSEDFFATTRSYRKHWYSKVQKDNRVKLYYRKNGDSWKSIDFGRIAGFTTEKKEIDIGSDWLIEKKSRKAWVWDGSRWNEEDIKGYLQDGMGLDSKIYSLGGNKLAVSWKSGKKTKIIYNINKSFVNPVGSFFVREKTILEPVTDKVVKYGYSFLPNENAKEGFAFDEATNTPLMDVMKVDMPSGGRVERYLCDVKNGEDNVAVGSVCSEIQLSNSKSSKISMTKTYYERYRHDWPYPLYIDRDTSKVTISRGLKTVTKNKYSESNGMIKGIVKQVGNRKTEEKYLFVSDLNGLNNSYKSIADVFKNDNRLDVLVGSYSCIPNCNTGNIVTANANGFEKIDMVQGSTSEKDKITTVTSVWKFTPQSQVSEKDLKNQMIGIAFSGTPRKNWERQSYNSKYENKQVVETIEGSRNIKVASFVENKEGGKVYGKTANCGIDEGLMLSGESCNVKNWTGCDVQSLDGYAINTINSSGVNYSRYGRFSKSVLQLKRGTSLSGTIPNSRKESYLISVWMQYGSDQGGILSLSVNNKNVAQWETHPASLPADSVGKWKKIEWIETLGGNAVVSFTAQNISTPINLQDVRILPVNSTSTVNYWNLDWNKIQTLVDTRGVGTYVDFDELGREVDYYAETDSGSVYITQKKTFVDGNCSAYPNGSDQLDALFLNGEPQKLPAANGSRTATYVLTDPKVIIEFVPLVQNEAVRYMLYEEGKRPSEWAPPPSCGRLCFPSFAFTESSKSWVLEVDVVPFDDDENGKYVFYLKKKENDWVEYGSYSGFANGFLPKYISSFDSSMVLYKSKLNHLDTAVFNGNEWKANEVFGEEVSEFSTFAGSSGRFVSYVSAEKMPLDYSYLNYPKVYQVNGKSFNPRNISDKKVKAENVVLGQDASNNIVMLYNSDGRIGNKEKKDNSGNVIDSHLGVIEDDALYAMAWNSSKSSFEYIGSTPEFTYTTSNVDNDKKNVTFSTGGIKSYKNGVVNDYSAEAADVVVGPEGKLYVAYIGLSTYLQSCSMGSDDECNIPFVFVKRLYSASEIPGVTQSIWSGVSQLNGKPLFQGDILSWTDNVYDAVAGAKKIKMAYDGSSLYLAVSYELDENDDTYKRDNQPSFALTVFKGVLESNKDVNGLQYSKYLKWEPIKDYSINSAHYAKTVDDERSRVVYLNDNDDFEFDVRNGSPYVMFRNEDNKGGLTVIKYNGNRWLSIGMPSFAYPDKVYGSANLGINSNGNPYVVFKADNQLHNLNRKNNIIAMHYNPSNALDLTLSSFETQNVNFNKSCAFRQYILNYEANLDDGDVFRFKITPKTPSDVKEVQITAETSSADKEMKKTSYRRFLMSISDYSKGIEVPLEKGLNVVNVKLVGHDESFVAYNFNLYRYFESGPEVFTVNNSSQTYVGEGYDPSGTDSKIVVVDVVPKAYTSDEKIVFDVHFKMGWVLELKIEGKTEKFTVSSTIEIPINQLPLTDGFIYNEKGDTIPVIIKNPNEPPYIPEIVPWIEMSSSSSAINPWSKSSSSINSGTNSSSSVNPWITSSSSINSGTNISSSANPWAISSSSVSSGSSHSSSSGLNTRISTNVPDEIRNLTTALIFASSDVYVADGVAINGDIFAGKNVNIGVTASVNNNLYAGNSITLRNRANVNDVYYVSSIELQDGAKYATATKMNHISVPVLPQYSFSVGNADVLVESNRSLSLSSGKYRSFTARTGVTVNFNSGDYYFSSFYTDSDVKLNFAPGCRIWINGDFRLGNRSKMHHFGNVGDLFVYAKGNVTVETNVEMQSVLVAPNANISFSSGLHFNGYIYSLSFSIQPNSILE